MKKIPRSENEEADALAKAASQGAPLPLAVFFEVLKAPSVELQERAVLSISPVSSDDWRSEIIAYLKGQVDQNDEAWAVRMAQRAKNYMMIDEDLYRRGILKPLLRCVSQQEGIELMKEIHGGMCGAHMAPRALLGKTLRAGFYWSKAVSDAEEIVRTCDNCQRMAKE